MMTVSILSCGLMAFFALGDSSVADRLRLMAEDGPLVTAHRGDSAFYPENTMPAFLSALEKGAEIIELDFFQSQDGVFFCHHDVTLDRTTDATRRFERTDISAASLRWEELSQLDAGSWKANEFEGTRLPLLVDAIVTIAARAIPMIEHKGGSPAALVALLREHGLRDKVLLQSFDWAWLEKVRTLDPEITLAGLGPGNKAPQGLEALLEESRRLGLVAIHWSGHEWPLEWVAPIKKAELLLAGYTLNNDLEFLGAKALGIDLITTDDPLRLRKVLTLSSSK